jgi:O-antigen/teichoic acid export membrane protein
MASFLSDLVRVGFSKVNIIIFGVGTSIATARLLTPDQNGIIATLLVYPSLFMVLGSMGIRQSTTYFVGKEIFSLDRIRNAVTQIWLITSVISMVVCFFLFYFLSKNIPDYTLVFVSISSIPFSLHNTYCSGIFLGKNEIKEFNKINWIPNFITFLATVLLIYFFNLEILGAMLAYLLGHLSIFIALILKRDNLHLKSLSFDAEVIKKMLSLGLVYAIALLIVNLNYKIDVVLLENLSTSYELGIYSKGASIVQYLWQIPLLFSSIIFARSAVSKDGLAFSRKVAQLLRLSLIMVSFVAIVLMLLSKPVILLLFGEAFLDSVPVMQILLPGVVLLTVFKVMNMDLAGKGKPWIAMKSMVVPLLINLGCNFYFIPLYGSKGAALSSLISYSSASLFFLYFYSKETGIPIRDIIRYKKTDFEPFKQILHKIVHKLKR